MTHYAKWQFLTLPEKGRIWHCILNQNIQLLLTYERMRLVIHKVAASVIHSIFYRINSVFVFREYC